MAGVRQFWRAATLTVKVATVSAAIVVFGAIANAFESTGSVQAGGTGPDPTTTAVSTTLAALEQPTTTAPATTTTSTTTTTTIDTTTSLVLPTTSIAALAPTTTHAPTTTQGCHPSYRPCVPIVSDVDCIGGSGNGPFYTGRVEVIGPDVYDLDRDNDGIGCET